jgi:uncharacterized protein YdaU (DUF1376 family)
VRAGWWWIDRWRKSTAYTDMTLAEQGAYRNLLDELWLRHGFLPNDERILAKIAGDAAEWPKVRSAVLARFVLTTSGWRNLTHDEVSHQSMRRKEKQQRYRERVSGNADGNETGNASGNGTGNKGGSPSPSPSPSLDLLEIPVISPNGTSARTPLPPLLRKGGFRKGKRPTRAELKDAAHWRASTMRPCQHEPKCSNVDRCIERIAYEMRDRKAARA